VKAFDTFREDIMRTLISVLLLFASTHLATASEDPREVHHVVDVRCPQNESDWGYQLSRNLLNERSAMTITYREGKPVRMVVRIGRDHQPMQDHLDLSVDDPKITPQDVAQIEWAGHYFRVTWKVFCGAGANVTAEGEAKLRERRKLAGVEGDLWKRP
jgi:hypothetical protein